MKLPLKHTGKITPENVLHDLLVNLKVSSLNVKRLKKTFVSILPSRHFASQGTQVFFCWQQRPIWKHLRHFFCSCWASTVANKNIEINETSPSPLFRNQYLQAGRKFQLQNSTVLSIHCQTEKTRHWYDWVLFGLFIWLYFVVALGLQFVLFCSVLHQLRKEVVHESNLVASLPQS